MDSELFFKITLSCILVDFQVKNKYEKSSHDFKTPFCRAKNLTRTKICGSLNGDIHPQHKTNF